MWIKAVVAAQAEAVAVVVVAVAASTRKARWSPANASTNAAVALAGNLNVMSY